MYLDFYPPIPHPTKGSLTRREYLGLYIPAKPKTPLEKDYKKETLLLGEQIRQKRELTLNKPEIYSEYEKEKLEQIRLGNQSFLDYFQSLAMKRKSSNHDNWMSAQNYLHDFSDGDLKFNQINEKWCEEFKEYLLTTKSRKSNKVTLATNSAVSYFNKVKAALKQGYKDGYLSTDINSKVESIKPEDSRREYLTLDELNRLANTPCNNPVMKSAALFSALTGLRFSDIQKLTWLEVEHEKHEGYSLRFKQKKTKEHEVLPISDQAFSLLGERQNPTDKVFEGLTYSAYQNKHLFQWIGAAGITKDITFHCFRHTFATLQLFNGTDIFTVSKMLGHKNLKTTQIYTKIVDQRKREAADKIQLDLK